MIEDGEACCTPSLNSTKHAGRVISMSAFSNDAGKDFQRHYAADIADFICTVLGLLDLIWYYTVDHVLRLHLFDNEIFDAFLL